MRKEDLAIFEMEKADRKNSVLKNGFISGHPELFLGVTERESVSAGKLETLLLSGELPSDTEVLVVCASETEELFELSLQEMLTCGLLSIVSVIFKRELLQKAGNYNEALSELGEYEFVCRLLRETQNGYCLFLPAQYEKMTVTEQTFFDYAYILRSFLVEMQAYGNMEEVLRQVYDLARNVGMKEVFERAFRDMTSGDRFQKINEYTAPILVFYGDEDVCSGVLRQFSEEITKALVKKGVAVHAGIAGQLDYDDMEKTIYKAVLGFQAAAFKNVFFQSLSGKKLQFWLDNPVFNQDMIKAMPKDCTFLCQDGNYADFIRKYYGYEAVVLPPGGCGSEWETLQERPYDISFLGAYQLPFAGVFRHEEKEYYDHMITHSGETFFFGMCEMQKENGTYVSDEESADRVRKMKHVCQYVINYYRDKVIRSIVEHGYKLHVYGNSWDAFPMQEMLVRHPEVKGGEALVEFSKAKIGLNVMSWHKNGLTERVLNIMRSGSVCLTDYSEAVAKNFNDGTDLVIFRLDETQRLPELIRELLQNDAWKMIGENGRAKAQKRHSWEVRAEEVLRILGETKKNKKI